MKKISLFLCSLLVSLAIITACNHSNSKDKDKPSQNDEPLSPEAVTTDEALAIIEQNKGNKNFVILDVRTDAELKEGYLKGHLEVSEEEENKHPHGGVLQHNFYADDIDQWLLGLDKGKRYLLHCRTDVRSKKSFEKLKAAGFKKIQYMLGGYTKWANEGKPIEKPEYEKVLDIRVVGDKIKTNSTIKFDFATTNLDGDPLRKAKISLQVLFNGTEVEKKELKTDNDGKETYTFNATSKERGRYKLVCKGTHKDANGDEYKETEAYYYFEVAEADEAVTGDSNDIKITDDVTSEMAKKFYNRNIYGYKAYNRDKQAVSLESSVKDPSKPTLVIFFSPLCSGCMTKAQELVTYNLDSITVIPVLTSINEEDLENEIKSNEKMLKDKFHLDDLVPSALYDAKDKIWFSRFKFKSTPKFVLINKEGQVKNIIHGGNDMSVENDLLKKMAEMFNLPAFQKK